MIALEVGGWLAASAGAVAAAGARRALAGRMESIARACHELRGPLTAARLGLEGGAGNSALTPDRLRAIDLELGRAALVIDDLDAVRTRRVWSRLPAPIDLRQLVSDSVEAWRPTAAAHGVELRASWSGDAQTVWGDRLRLAQVTGNLIANAIEHGGGTVEVHGHGEGAWARVEVTDTGPGLPAPVAELVRAGRAGGRPAAAARAARAARSRSRDRGRDRRRPGRPARVGAVGAWRTAGAGDAGGAAAGGAAAGGRRRRLRAAPVASVGVERGRGWPRTAVVAGVRAVMPRLGPGRVGAPRACVRSSAGAPAPRAHAFVRAPASPKSPAKAAADVFPAKLPREIPHRQQAPWGCLYALTDRWRCGLLRFTWWRAGGGAQTVTSLARSVTGWLALAGSLARWLVGMVRSATRVGGSSAPACHPRHRVANEADAFQPCVVTSLAANPPPPATRRRQHHARRHANPNPSLAPSRARAVSVPRDPRTRAGRNGGESATRRPEASTARSLAPSRNVQLTVVAHS